MAYSEHLDQVRKEWLTNTPGATLVDVPAPALGAYQWMVLNVAYLNDCLPCKLHDGAEAEA